MERNLHFKIRFFIQFKESIMLKRALVSGIAVAAVSVSSLCAANTANTVYQTAVSPSITQGVVKGNTTVEQLGKHGDFGLGLLNSSTGSLVAFEGAFYQIDKEGKVTPAAANKQTPFATVTFFNPAIRYSVRNIKSLDKLRPNIAYHLKKRNRNVPYAVKVTGDFKHLVLNSTTDNKTTPYEAQSTSGVLVGFWFPNYLQNVNVPEFQFVFLSNDKTTGGQVLDVNLDNALVEFTPMYGLEVAFPKSKAFAKAKIPAQVVVPETTDVAVKTSATVKTTPKAAPTTTTTKKTAS